MKRHRGWSMLWLLWSSWASSARDYVKGYICERGLKIRFATTWLDKP